jgi:hypothetical protein
MKNPYIFFGVSQDATSKEIQVASMRKQKEIRKTKEVTPQELMLMKKQLLSPEKRLIADFLFPKKIKGKRSKVCKITQFSSKKTEIKKVDYNAFDSL